MTVFTLQSDLVLKILKYSVAIYLLLGKLSYLRVFPVDGSTTKLKDGKNFHIP